jgi:hypothetical protein
MGHNTNSSQYCLHPKKGQKQATLRYEGKFVPLNTIRFARLIACMLFTEQLLAAPFVFKLVN